MLAESPALHPDAFFVKNAVADEEPFFPRRLSNESIHWLWEKHALASSLLETVLLETPNRQLVSSLSQSSNSDTACGFAKLFGILS